MQVSMTVLFPLTFASNVFVDPATMPGWVQAFVKVNPITHLTTAARGLMHGDVDASRDRLGARVERGAGGGLRPAHDAAVPHGAVADRCAFGLMPYWRLNAVLKVNGLP